MFVFLLSLSHLIAKYNNSSLQVLGLYGVSSLTINGKISFDQRTKHVKEFYDNNNESRVLVFSSVGTAGLNLAIADIVIFFVSH